MNRVRLCSIGSNVLIWFCISTLVAAAVLIPGYLGFYAGEGIKERPGLWIGLTILVFCIEFVMFWAGIILVYVTSGQLGIRYRVLGVVFGMVPIANLIMLGIIISVTKREVKVETELLKRDEERLGRQICKTKYPILMVHGVFFRDFEILNYWGRIPAELEKNGARIFYGNHNSAASVKESASELERRILEIVSETGCEKVNIIAHSKGGLDARRAVFCTSAGDYVASLTTINTPHRGCEFADYLLGKVPENVKNGIASKYNFAAAKLGDTNPDFLAAVYDLTSDKCAQFNEEVKDRQGVYYQSVGSRLKRASGGRFPLNFSYRFVKHFDGPNDGLVGEKSFRWGEDYKFISLPGRRGISHGDMIDLNRENIKGFDVREFYVTLVAELKNKGF